jgi:hypothetical protein
VPVPGDESLQDVRRDRQTDADEPQTSVDEPAVALTTTPAPTRPRFVSTATTRPLRVEVS